MLQGKSYWIKAELTLCPKSTQIFWIFPSSEGRHGIMLSFLLCLHCICFSRKGSRFFKNLNFKLHFSLWMKNVTFLNTSCSFFFTDLFKNNLIPNSKSMTIKFAYDDIKLPSLPICLNVAIGNVGHPLGFQICRFFSNSDLEWLSHWHSENQTRLFYLVLEL